MLALMENKELKEKFEGMYSWMYKGNPDNESIGYFFIGVAMYCFDKNMPVN
jgi:hypothetical protein